MKKLTKPQAEQLISSLRSWRTADTSFQGPFMPHEEELLDAFEKALADLPNAIHEPVQKAANFLFYLPYTQPENKFSSLKTDCKFLGYSRDFNIWRRALENCGLEFDYHPDGYPGRTVHKHALSEEPHEMTDKRRTQFITWLQIHVQDTLSEEKVHMGFTKAELTKAFDRLHLEDWRGPIGPKRIPRQWLNATIAAIEFFTATEVRVTLDMASRDDVTIEADGYRAGPAGDH